MAGSGDLEMQEFLTWGALIAAGGSLIALVKFWMDLGRYQERTEHAINLASAAVGKYETIIREFADYRVALEVKIAVVKTLGEANTSALSSAEHRLAKAMEDVRDQLGHFNERIDRLLEQRKSPT